MIISNLKTRRVATERYVEHQGSQLRYVVVGEGPPLVLIHGGNGSAENFDTWFDDVGSARTLLIPDLPGFGESQRLPGRQRHSPQNLSLVIDTVMADYGVDRVDLGGLCMGACVALAFYRRRRQDVGKLILHTPLISPPLIMPKFRRHVSFMIWRPLFPFFTWAGRTRWISDWYKRHFTEGEVADDTGADINFINQKRCYPRAAREWVYDALRCHDVDLIRERKDPTLMLLAGEDMITNIDGVIAMAGDLPGVSLAIFDNAGHGWSRDFVERQNSVLCAFLEDREFPATARLRTAPGVAVA
jgi:pimeloyl-ACP methyl ester carboxylesterase